MTDLWHYSHDGQSLGPITKVQLEELAASGGLAAQDLVWTEGMAAVPAAQVQGLFGTLASGGHPLNPNDFRTPNEKPVLYCTYVIVLVLAAVTIETVLIPIYLGLMFLGAYVARKNAYGTFLRTAPRASETQFPRIYRRLMISARRWSPLSSC